MRSKRITVWLLILSGLSGLGCGELAEIPRAVPMVETTANDAPAVEKAVDSPAVLPADLPADVDVASLELLRDLAEAWSPQVDDEVADKSGTRQGD
jgi:hypothetical protein